jgi:hypothetical protein
MFRNTSPAPVAEPAPDVTPPADLISLVELSLSLPEPSEGWALFLGRRGISFRSDDLGRDSISRGDAKRLLDEQRADELRVRALRAQRERQAVEQDRVRRAQIWRGIPAIDLPVGVSASTAMLAADHDTQPRRTSVLQEALAGKSLTFHSYQTSPEDESA